MHFEYGLGNFDSSIYCPADNIEVEIVHRRLSVRYLASESEEFEPAKSYNCVIGWFFLIFFNSANLILLLNLIIAILSTTYAFFEDKMTGLYYEVIVNKFATMEYDSKYGAAACATSPLNLMIFPLQWILIFDWFSDEFLISYNNFLCYLLYFPLSILFTAVFAAVDIVFVPFSYLLMSFRLLMRSFQEKEEKDKNSFHYEITFLKFLIFGPIILALSIPVDCFVFYYNLYSAAPKTPHKVVTHLTLDNVSDFNICL